MARSVTTGMSAPASSLASRQRFNSAHSKKTPDFSFRLQAKAAVPAGGGITGKVTGDVALDALVAEVGGGLSVKATAGLEGAITLEGDIQYAKEKFSVDVKAAIGGGVVLDAELGAHVYAEAGVWKLKVRTDKYWKLGSTRFDHRPATRRESTPLHYDSVDGLRMPSFDDIKPDPEKLSLDSSSMLSSRLMGQAKTEEKDS